MTGTGFSGLWFTALLSWIVKATVLKIGGVRLYRKAVPFFNGVDFRRLYSWLFVEFA